MMNCNPETVSTDYDTSSRLYFEPLTVEDVLNVIEEERPDGIIVQFGGQTPLKLAGDLQEALTKFQIPAASGRLTSDCLSSLLMLTADAPHGSMGVQSGASQQSAICFGLHASLCCLTLRSNLSFGAANARQGRRLITSGMPP